MRNINIFFTFFVVLLLSCDIHRAPELNITDDTFWRNEADLKAAANYFYTFLPGFSTEENWSDNSFGRTSNSISDGSRLTPTGSGDYSGAYALIRATNKLLEKSEPLQGVVEEDILNQYRAEARFFRAFAYFDLLRKFGDVPLILKVLNDESEELYAPRSTRDEILEVIYDDLEFASGHLPWPSGIGATDYGRISKSAALAMRARVGLFEGTRAKFHNYGDPSKHLNIAITDSRKVMDSGEHELLSNYFHNFQYEGEGPDNTENILVRQYGVSRTDHVVTTNHFRANIEQGNINPTKSLVDDYLMTDGLPIDKSPLYKLPVESIDVFDNRDARLGATVFKRGDEYIATRPEFTIANPNFNTTGFTFRKYTNIDDWQTQRGLMDYIVIRYAEVLLTYAEAYFELNESISDDILNETVNLLRERGGIALLSNDFIAQNGLNMRTELRRERRVEFAQEDQRYWDLIRWKTAEDELPKTVLGNYFFDEELGEVNVTVTEDNIIMVHDASFRTFDPQKHYLWPLPTNELALNTNLEQNPGWD